MTFMKRCLAIIQIGLLLLVAGCNSDPHAQRAVGMLRAEKLELEDRYYELESRYLQAMRELGRPPELPIMGSGVMDYLDSTAPVITNPVFDDTTDGSPGIEILAPENGFKVIDPFPQQNETLPSGDSTPSLPPGGASRGRGQQYTPTNSSNFAETFGSQTTGEVDELQIQLGTESPVDSNPPSAPKSDSLAGHIQKILAGPGQSSDDNLIKIVIQPLDENGAVIPIPGKVRIRVRDARTNQQIGSWNYSARETAQWLNIEDNQSPGIHIELPRKQLEVPGPSSQVLVDFAAGGRRFKQAFQIQWDDDEDLTAGRDAESRPVSNSGAAQFSLPEWTPDR